ncbi:MFS general substrate transporter [Backusella circina FSU 941]|nr:MFS general substrate transporter [Backusella circina FSU 941]
MSIIILLVSNYGAIIAMFLMPTIATGKDRIEFTVIIVALIASIAAVPLFFFPKKPPTPASAIRSTDAQEGNKLTLMQSTLLLIKNPHFLILCVVHGLNIGLSIAWNGLMNQAMTPYGYNNHQVGNIAAVSIVAGTLGCVISGPVLDKTKQHKILLKIMAPLMFSTYIAYIFVIKEDTFAAILYVNALSQFFLSFMVPVCVELGVEISYPVTESLSTSILWQIAQLIGFILVFIMDLFRDENGTPHNNMYNALIFQAVIAGVCALFALVFNGKMLRTEAIQEKSQKRDVENTIHHRYDSCETIHVLESQPKENEV